MDPRAQSFSRYIRELMEFGILAKQNNLLFLMFSLSVQSTDVRHTTTDIILLTLCDSIGEPF